MNSVDLICIVDLTLMILNKKSCLKPTMGLEPTISRLEAERLIQLGHAGGSLRIGFEPMTFRLTAGRSTY